MPEGSAWSSKLPGSRCQSIKRAWSPSRPRSSRPGSPWVDPTRKRQADRLAWAEAMAAKGYLAEGQLLSERQTLARCAA